MAAASDPVGVFITAECIYVCDNVFAVNSGEFAITVNVCVSADAAPIF